MAQVLRVRHLEPHREIVAAMCQCTDPYRIQMTDQLNSTVKARCPSKWPHPESHQNYYVTIVHFSFLESLLV